MIPIAHSDLCLPRARGVRARLRLSKVLIPSLWYWKVQTEPFVKRAIDIAAAAILLAASGPVWLLCVLSKRGRALVEHRARVGLGAERFEELSFSENDRAGVWLKRLHLTHVPVLWNVLRGDLSLVGPRPVSPSEIDVRNPLARQRCGVRPGLVCNWWIRQRTRIAYDEESVVDRDYVETHRLSSDLGIMLRVLPAALFGKAAPAQAPRVDILGVEVDNVTMTDAVSMVVDALARGGRHEVCFVNPHCLNIAVRQPEYRCVLQQASLVFADGSGIQIAGNLLRRPLRQNVNGTDMFPLLCRALEGAGVRVYLIGARPGVAAKVRTWMEQRHPAIEVCGVRDGFFADAESPAVAHEIAASKATLLLVAMGVPRQELWIHRWMAETGVTVAIGVGGLFDFCSGNIPRAPVWMREVGIEWVYRILQEPGRLWRRYLVGNAQFLASVLRQRLQESFRRPLRG